MNEAVAIYFRYFKDTLKHKLKLCLGKSRKNAFIHLFIQK